MWDGLLADDSRGLYDPREPIYRDGTLYLAPVSTLPIVSLPGGTAVYPSLPVPTPIIPVPPPPSPITPTPQPATGLANALGASISLGGLRIPVWLIVAGVVIYALKGK